jgi:PAS domain S-box-containing protein
VGIGRLFESIRDAVVVAEADTGRIVLWNPAATEIFGYSPTEALELHVDDLVPDRLKAQHQAGLDHYRETGHGAYVDSGVLLDLPAVRKTGEEIRIEMSLAPVNPTDDATVGGRLALAIIRDTTERKRI